MHILPFHGRSHRHNRLLLLLCLILVLLSDGRAQTARSSHDENYTIASWDVADGLPQGTVRAITKSADGYLWLATNAGVVRFDGIRFRAYDRLDAAEMRPHIVTALVARRDSSMWAGTADGKVFVYANKRWVHLSRHLPGVSSPINAMAVDRNGIVWIGTSDAGLLRGARTPDGVDTIVTGFVQPELDAPAVTAILPEDDGTLWLGGVGGIARVVGAGIRTYQFDGAFRQRTVSRISSDSTGGLWIAFSDGGVCRFDPSPPGVLTPEEFSGSYAFDELFDPSRPALRLGLLSGALTLFEGRAFPQNSDEGRLGTQMISMFRDDEGNFWFGSVLEGLIRLRPAPFEMIQRDVRQSVTSIYQRRNGEIYVGLNCGGVGIIRGSTIDLLPLSARMADACVWSVFVDSRERLWIGTWGGGVYRADLRDPSTKPTQFSKKSFIGSDVVLAIAQAPDGALWFGTRDAGVVRWTGSRSDRWGMDEGLPSNDVRAIAFDSVGGVWIGTQGGLALIGPDGVRSFRTADGLTSSLVRTLHAEKDGSLWIGTQGGGLVRLRNGVFSPITTEQGLFDNTVSQFLQGVKGFVWMGSNRGVWRVSKDELVASADRLLDKVNAIAYGRSDGLLVVETNGGFQPNGLRTPTGDLLFPTLNGVARIRTENLRINTTPPPVIIERITADGTVLSSTSSVTVAPDVEEIEITFTALSFIAPEKVRFRYRLGGYNRNWIDAGNDRTVRFANLNPGTYHFNVTAANNDGIWNEEGAEVTIVVQTPFWETPWFRGLAVMALIGMGMLVVSVRLRRVRLQKEMQEATSQRLIQSQEEERQRIAGELHDSLGQELIVAKNRVMLAAHHLPEESKARSELTQVADALSIALKSVRAIAYNLRPFQLDRLGLTETLRSTIRTIQQATKITFETEIENIDGLLDHEGEIGLFRVVQEALTNVVKHSNATRATVVVTRDEDAVVVRVSDDGVGFDHDTGHENPPALGFGIPGMTERVRLLRGMSKITSSPGRGTTVAIRLPARGRKEEYSG